MSNSATDFSGFRTVGAESRSCVALYGDSSRPIVEPKRRPSGFARLGALPYRQAGVKMNSVSDQPALKTGGVKRRLADEFPNRVRPAKFAHVVLTTPNLRRARDWYLEVLDGHVSYENDMVCFLSYDDERHRIGLVGVPGLVERPANSWGLDHLAFTYPTLGALLAHYTFLKSKGLTPYWPINHGPTLSFYYRAPDGNKVEMQYDVFGQLQERDAVV